MYNFLWPNSASWRYHVTCEDPKAELQKLALLVSETTGRKVEPLKDYAGESFYYLGRNDLQSGFDKFMFSPGDYCITVYVCDDHPSCCIVSLNRRDGGDNEKVRELRRIIESMLNKHGFQWKMKYFESRLSI